MYFFEVGVDHNRLFLLAIQNLLDGVGHGLRGNRTNLPACGQKGVDEAAFSRFDLAGYHKHEGFGHADAQLAYRICERLVADGLAQLVQVLDQVFDLYAKGLCAGADHHHARCKGLFRTNLRHN